jgi:hypothetical protein
MIEMSNGERWVYRYIGLTLVGLLVIVVIQHIPSGG